MEGFRVSFAVVNGLQFLLTWNFEHLAIPEFDLLVESIGRHVGFEPPVKCNPLELLELCCHLNPSRDCRHRFTAGGSFARLAFCSLKPTRPSTRAKARHSPTLFQSRKIKKIWLIASQSWKSFFFACRSWKPLRIRLGRVYFSKRLS